MVLCRLFLGFLAAFLLTTAHAFALTGAWDRGEAASVRLVAATGAAGSDLSLPFGLEFKLEPGWKIYWRTPGDAGFPPLPKWDGSENVADVRISWPVPRRFEIFDIGTLGYEDHVILPLSVTPEKPSEAVSLRAGIDYLVCSDICIPGRADVALDLPSGDAFSTVIAHDVNKFSAAVPVVAETHLGLRVDSASVQEQADSRVTLGLAVSSEGQAFSAVDAFIEGPGGAYFDRPIVELSNDGQTAILYVDAPSHITVASLAQDGVTITLVDGDRALETSVTPTIGMLQPSANAPIAGSVISPDSLGLLPVLVLALLGGLILNLMPCVLPVLSIKLLSFVEKSGQEHRQIRLGFLANSAGILASFLVLAAAAIAVKAAGLSVGWGIQFQQPVFLALMVALLTLFACNLVGIFAFRLPSFLSDGAARAGATHKGLLGDFLTGAFATLLATPCSAPFLGTAVGFALGAGAFEILTVFSALGIGLAAPYLLIAAFPSLVRLMPRPGRWMLWIKFGLTVALIGTAIWLLSVLSVSLGIENAIGIGGLSVAAALVLAMRKLPASRLAARAWPISGALAGATVIAPLIMTPATAPYPLSAENPENGNVTWQPFNEEMIPDLVADGKTVLVDVTADWCITCKWNKAAVLDAAPIATWLSDPSVVAMKADWTRPNPAIADYLSRHGRYGIPFNIIYGPESPSGIVLPELLSEAAVIQAARTANSAGRVVHSE